MKTCAYCGQPSEDDVTRCAGCGMEEFQSDVAAAPPSPPPVPAPAPLAAQVVPRTLTPEEESLAFVTLCTCRSIEEADLIVTKLQSVGIEATVPDEYLQQAVAWNLNTYGYVRVQVPTGLYQQAVQALSEAAPAEPSAPAQPEDTEGDRARAARAAEPLPLSMKCLLFVLPGTVCAGLIIAAVLRLGYLNRGYQQRADAVWKYFAVGLVFWSIVFLSIVASRS